MFTTLKSIIGSCGKSIILSHFYSFQCVILSETKDLITYTYAFQIFRYAQQYVFTTFRMTSKGAKVLQNPTLSPTLARKITSFHHRMSVCQTICQSEKKKNIWHEICFYIVVQTEAPTERLGPGYAHKHYLLIRV